MLIFPMARMEILLPWILGDSKNHNWNQKSEHNVPIFDFSHYFAAGATRFFFFTTSHPWDAGPAGFLFYQAIMFGHPFGWALGFGLDCCCIQLYYSLCCYTLILLLASYSDQSMPILSLAS